MSTTRIASPQTKVVFPAPPPTTNSLTNQQRTQLLRKTKKLEQLLGAAPHLIDPSSSLPNDSVHVALPSQHKRRASVSTTASQRSFDSFSSGSVASTHSSSSRLLSSSLERSSSFSGSRSARRSSMLLKKPSPPPSPPHLPPSYETWSETKPPFLLIDTESDADRLYWASTCGPSSKGYTLALSSRDSDSEDTSPSSPSFTISASSTRKTKMDRLRRKLGHGVPIELVFPGATNDGDDDDDEVTSDGSFELVTPPTSCDELPTSTSPSPRKSKSSKSIAKSRDSLFIHQAPRKSSSSSPTSPSSAPLPPIPAVPSAPKSVKGRPLSAILEGTDEQFYLEKALTPRIEETLEVLEPDSISASARRRWSLRI